jgi:hypothetical protein
MRLQVIYVGFVALFLAVFLLFGMPYLKTIRDEKPILSFGGDEGIELGSRLVQPIDITIEDVCLNIVTGDIDTKCQSTAGCDQMCRSKGCQLFGLIYNSSNYTEKRCFCNCLETNKIKKALNID